MVERLGLVQESVCVGGVVVLPLVTQEQFTGAPVGFVTGIPH